MAQIKQQVEAAGGQLLVAMTPLKRETLPPGPRDYETVARQRVEQFMATMAIPYLDLLPIFQTHRSPETLYRDHIHLSPIGDQLVSQQLAAALRQQAEQELSADLSTGLGTGLSDAAVSGR